MNRKERSKARTHLGEGVTCERWASARREGHTLTLTIRSMR
jgi:hypothetical protein